LVEYIREQGWDPKKVVFYNTGPYASPQSHDTPPFNRINRNGKTMANNFVKANPGYVTYDQIFNTPKFEADFNYVAWATKPENANKQFQVFGSDAIALFAERAYAFNTDGGK
jgi:hypothetical protein